MAKKIDARISLRTNGTGQVVSSVSRLTDSIKRSSSAVDRLKMKLASINVGVKIAALASSMMLVGSIVRGVGRAFSTVGKSVDGFATKVDGISKFSRTIGMSASQLQQWQYVAERGGMSADGMDKSLKKLSVNISKAASGEKKQLSIFNALGISLRKSNGDVKNTNDLMLELADAYEKISNKQDKMRLTEELFGKSNLGIINALEGGSQSVRNLMDRKSMLGGLISEEDARNAEEFKDRLLDVGQIAGAIKTTSMSTILPFLNSDMKDLIEWWKTDSGDFLKDVKDSTISIYSAIKSFAVWFYKAYEVASRMDEVIEGVVITITGGMLDFKTIFYKFAQPFMTFFTEKIPNYVEKAKNFIVGVFDSLYDSITGVFDGMKDGVLNAIASLTDKLSGLPFIGDKFAGLSNDLRSKVTQKESPVAAEVRSYTESKTLTSKSKLQVDFSGMPNGASVTPSSGFDYGSIDYSTGYTFGY